MSLNSAKTKILEDEIHQMSAALDAKKEELRRLRETRDDSASPNKISLTNSEISRFSRQIILPEIGVKGQIKLRDAKVLIVGAGGLGNEYVLKH